MAENVFFVYYPYKVNAQAKPKDKNKIFLFAAKVRYGETGAIPYKAKFEVFIFFCSRILHLFTSFIAYLYY